MRSGRRVLTAVLVACALVLSGSAPATAAPIAASEQVLEDRVRALLPELPGRYTIDVRELDGERRTLRIGAATRREPASTVKLFLAYAAFRRIDLGLWTPETRLPGGTTVGQCLRAMIEPSDNFCAIDFRRAFTEARLNRLMVDDGYQDTRFWYAGDRTKVTSARDVSLLLARLANGTLLSEESSAAFLRLLETQVWREAIPPGLPAGTRQASKPGTLYVGSGMVQTDAAIVWGARSRYVITVFGSHGATIPAITRIARTVQRTLQGPIGTPFVYDREQMRTTAAVPVRSGSGASSSVLRTVPAGTRVEVIDSARTRYLVRAGGVRGWMSNADLVLREPAS